MRSRVRAALLPAAIASVISGAVCSSSLAQISLYWDGDGTGTVGGGTGTWSTSAARWSTTSTGNTYAAWTNGNSASFANTAGTVTISGGVTVNDLTFGVSGYTVTGGTLTFGSGSAIATGAFDATINSTLAGSGVGFTKTGTGTLTLGGTNTYTGTTTLNNGIVSVSANANLGNGGAVAFGGGVLYLTSSFDSTRAVSLGTGGGTFNTVGSGVTSTWSGVITGGVATDGLTKNGSGTLTLTGANTYLGATTINTGTLVIDAETRLGTTPASYDAAHLTLAGATLRTTATTSISANRGVTLGSGGGTFEVDPSSTLTIASIIAETAGPSTLTKTGTGTLKLTGANSYTGATDISAGVLNLQHALGLGTSAAGTTVASGATLQLQGGITVAAEALTLNGTGVSSNGALRNISGANTFGGAITLGSASEIQADSASTLTLSGGITGAFSLTFDGAGNTTVSGVIGTGALIKNGSGTLTLSGNNTYAGGTTLNAGTLALGASSRLANTGSVTVAGGTFDVGAFSDTVGAVTFQSGSITGTTGVLTGSSYALQSGSVSAILGGTGALTKSTSGTVTLSGANTYSGGTTLNAGILAVSADTHLGGATGGLTFTGGTLQLGASFDTARTVAASTGSGTIDTNGFNSTLSGVLSGSTALTKSGTGTLTLSNAANSYSGTLTVSAGTLNLTNSTALATATLSVSSGATTTFGTPSATATLGGLAGGGIVAFPSAFGNTLTLTVGGNNVDTTFDGLLSTAAGSGNGFGDLVKTGSGTLTLTNAGNSYAGATNINGGLIKFNSLANFGVTGFGSINLNGGGLQWASGNTADVSSRLVFKSGGGTLQIDSGVVSFATGLTGETSSSTVTKTGNGTLALTVSPVSFSGTVVASQGTLRLDVGTAITGGTLNVAGGTVLFGPTVTTATLAGLSGSGDIALVNTAGSPAAVTLSIGSAGGTYSGQLSGAGALTKTSTSTGTLTLTGSNTFTGGLTVSGGTVQLGSSGTVLADTLPVTVNAGTFTLGANETIGTLAGTTSSGSRVSLGASTLTLAGSGDTSYAGIISGTGGLTKTGSGILSLTNAHTFSGPTSVTAGTLNLSNLNTLASSTLALTGTGAVIFTGITASYVGGLSGTQPIVLTNAAGSAATLIVGFNTNTTSTYDGALSGLGALQKSGSGTLTLTGTHTHVGSTNVAGGTLQLGNGGTTGSVSGNLVFSNGATAQFNRSDAVAYSGSITGTGTLVQAGTGTLTLSGANTYTGTTTVSSGTLAFANTGAMNNTGQNISVSSGATVAANYAIDSTFLSRLTSASAGTVALGVSSANSLNFSTNSLASVSLGATGTATYSGTLTPASSTYRLGGGGGTLTVSSVLSGTRSLVVSGAGSTVILTGANTFSGGTTISFGTVTTSHTTALGTGPVNLTGATSILRLAGPAIANTVSVGAGSTLTGSGGVGALSVSGTVSPGNSPGTLASGATTFAGGGNYVWEINHGTGTSGTNWDLLSISGALTITATSGSPFTINLTSLLADNSAGNVINFNTATNHTYTVATASSGITGFSSSAFTLDTAGFTNALNGGSWSIGTAGNDLNLTFTASAIPEPSTYAALLGAAALALAAHRRRRKSPPTRS